MKFFVTSTTFIIFLFCPVARAQETKCTDCHAYVKEGDQNVMPEELAKSIHSKKGINCTSCHGDDKFNDKKSNPHLLTKSFKGKPKDRNVAEFCGACHKQELESFSKSPHHATTKQGLTKGCISCHGYHTVAEPTHKDLINLCIKCHKEGSKEYEGNMPLKQSFEEREAEFIKLSREISGIQDTPGIDTKSIETVKNIMLAKLDMLKKSQHTMETGGIKSELETLAKDIDKEHGRVAGKHDNLAERKIWLSIFIFATLLIIALVNIKLKNEYKPTPKNID